MQDKEITESLINLHIGIGKKENLLNTDNISDGWHTFGELYDFRLQYNAALFNAWGADKTEEETKYYPGEGWVNPPKFEVHKSWKHEDGEFCFGEEKKWFIVSAMLPTGLISNHYKAEHWDLFKIPEVEKVIFKFDGHTGHDVLERLKQLNLK